MWRKVDEIDAFFREGALGHYPHTSAALVALKRAVAAEMPRSQGFQRAGIAGRPEILPSVAATEARKRCPKVQSSQPRGGEVGRASFITGVDLADLLDLAGHELTRFGEVLP